MTRMTERSAPSAVSPPAAAAGRRPDVDDHLHVRRRQHVIADYDDESRRIIDHHPHLDGRYDDDHVIPPNSGGDQADTRAKTGRVSWREMIRP
jgi:hypothetical protein